MLVCSGDMLLEALAACAGVTLRAVATALGYEVGGTVHVEGDLDFRGTLGVAKDEGVPVGFTAPLVGVIVAVKVTDWPAAVGFGLLDVIAIVVSVPEITWLNVPFLAK